MIRITKPKHGPAILRTMGRKLRAEHCRAYRKHPGEFCNGTRTFSFRADIYGHPTVKDGLVNAQYGKCCFCEAEVGHDGDVEHFRPKSAVTQAKSIPLLRPGYYWLAYEWSNLFLCCSACNQRNKRNLFPLVHPTQRARKHSENYQLEQLIFIHPVDEDPEQFISFRKEIPYAINGNSRGKRTIAALGIDRPIMNERRRKHLKHIAIIQNFIDQESTRPQTQEWIDAFAEAKQYLTESTQDNAPFAGVVRAKNRGW